jgi:hypothetical protein
MTLLNPRNLQHSRLLQLPHNFWRQLNLSSKLVLVHRDLLSHLHLLRAEVSVQRKRRLKHRRPSQRRMPGTILRRQSAHKQKRQYHHQGSRARKLLPSEKRNLLRVMLIRRVTSTLGTTLQRPTLHQQLRLLQHPQFLNPPLNHPHRPALKLVMKSLPISPPIPSLRYHFRNQTISHQPTFPHQWSSSPSSLLS